MALDEVLHDEREIDAGQENADVKKTRDLIPHGKIGENVKPFDNQDPVSLGNEKG